MASWLCPPHLRAPIAAIYHFARTADDIADEGSASAEERLRQLADYRAQLDLAAHNAAAQGDAEPAVAQAAVWDPRWAGLFACLQGAIQAHGLPVACLHALLDAFVQDVVTTRDGTSYATETEVLDYCRRSANPVGRLLLHLYGVQDAAALERSDAICTALQLINFWQDPSVDLPRGRNYFAQDLLNRHGLGVEDLRAARKPQALRALVQECVDQARARMARGAPLVHQIPGRAGWELRLVVQGGLRILDRIETLGAAALSQRPTLRTSDYLAMVWRALWM